MFKALFGHNKRPPPLIVDAHSTMDRLSDQMNSVEKRIKKLEADQRRLLEEALQKKKTGDQRGALFSLKRKKMMERELAKLDGQITLLEQQRMVIETSVQDVNVFKVLGEGAIAVEHMSKQVNIDKLEDIREKMDEQNAELDECREFFIEAGKVGEMEEANLIDELNELEAELAGRELEQINLPAGQISKVPSSAPSAIQKKPEEKSIEEEIKELERMMA